MQKTGLGIVLLAAGLTFAQQPTRSTAKTTEGRNRTTLTNADQKFAREAAIGGMAEVELGRMATEKAQNPAVKSFGERMVKDHTKANDDLKSVAAKENISLPTSLDASHEATKDRLSKLSGAEFDRAYMKDMVKDHDADVKEFQHQAQTGTNTGIRDFAARTLPTLEEHQKLAHDTERQITGRTTTSK